MKPVLLVLSTFPDQEQARQIGTVLVERQLAACVNLFPGVESIYRWQGKRQQEEEVLVLIKTTEERYPALRDELGRLHPYEVPEIVALRPQDVAQSYARWVGDCCQEGDGTGAPDEREGGNTEE